MWWPSRRELQIDPKVWTESPDARRDCLIVATAYCVELGTRTESALGLALPNRFGIVFMVRRGSPRYSRSLPPQNSNHADKATPSRACIDSGCTGVGLSIRCHIRCGSIPTACEREDLSPAGWRACGRCRPRLVALAEAQQRMPGRPWLAIVRSRITQAVRAVSPIGRAAPVGADIVVGIGPNQQLR